MNRLFALTLMILFSASNASADYCLTVREHKDSHYHHGSMQPAEDSENEIWFADDRIAIHQKERRFIIDSAARKFTVVEMKDSVYIETPLPLELSALVPEEQVMRLAMFPTVGEVEKLHETRKINGKNCNGYLLKTWVMYQGNRYNERESRIWSTSDIPVKRELLDLLNRTTASLRNMSDQLKTDFSDITGINFLSETVEYSEGFEIYSSTEVVKCGEMEPAADVYSIPDGFSKQERLSPGRR